MPSGPHGERGHLPNLMNCVLRPHGLYTAAYIVNIVIYNSEKKDHLRHITTVLQALKEAGLMANPAKGRVASWEVAYLSYMVGWWLSESAHWQSGNLGAIPHINH